QLSLPGSGTPNTYQVAGSIHSCRVRHSFPQTLMVHSVRQQLPSGKPARHTWNGLSVSLLCLQLVGDNATVTVQGSSLAVRLRVRPSPFAGNLAMPTDADSCRVTLSERGFRVESCQAAPRSSAARSRRTHPRCKPNGLHHRIFEAPTVIMNAVYS